MSTAEDDRGSSRSVLVVAAVLAVLMVIGVVVIALPGGGTPQATEPPVAPEDVVASATTPQPTSTTPSGTAEAPAPEPTAPAVAAGGGGSSGCDLPDGPDVLPVTAPETTWELYGAIAAPTSPTVGPGRREDGIWSCYAPTAEGSVFAATNALIHADEAEDKEAVFRTLFADRPGLAVVLDALEQFGEEEGSSNGSFIAGFNVLRHTDEESAIVDVLLSSGGGFASVTIAMVWEGGDWLVDTPLDGQWGEIQTVPSAAGYVPWSP